MCMLVCVRVCPPAASQDLWLQEKAALTEQQERPSHLALGICVSVLQAAVGQHHSLDHAAQRQQCRASCERSSHVAVGFALKLTVLPRLPPGNITVVAMPRSGSSAVHLTNYIRQDPWWTEAMHSASTWPACVWVTKIKPFSGRVSQLMLENPDSIIGFQPIGHFLTIRILTELAAAAANHTQAAFDVQSPLTTGASAGSATTCNLY